MFLIREARWDSNLQALRAESMTPYVVIGLEFHPMQRTALTTNRWETYVPVPPTQNSLRYHFKGDYEYSQFSKKPGKASVISPEYKLNIVER